MADIKISALPAGVAAPTGVLPVVNAGVTQRITVKNIVDLATASMPSGTVNTTASGGLVGITSSPNLSIQQWSDEMALKAAFQNRGVEFSRINVNGPGDAGDVTAGEGWVISTAAYFSRLYYGEIIGRAGGPGYELPTPTGDGYLRSDLNPSTGWYFAEPVLISDTEPPAPAGGNAIWIDPTGTAGPDPNAPFSNVNPPVYLDAPITETATSPLGIVNDIYVEPDVVGAVPVVVNGKRYLLPLLEAPASTALRTPLFSFADDPVNQQSDGAWIGFDNTGLNYYQPETIAAVPILVGGKKYLLPLITE